MPRELSKCRKWEKERRGRLNECFSKLGKLLPCYDPSSTLSKIDILTKSAAFIEDLQNKLKESLTTDTENKPERAELKQLYLRVKHLLSRNEQLSNLLRDAGITIPSECGGVKITKTKKWAGKITPEKAEIIAKIESQKENEPKKIKVKRAPNKKQRPKPKPKVKCKTIVSKKGVVLNNNLSKSQVVTIANVQPCYFITNAVTKTPNTTLNVTTVTNTPILSTTTQSAPINSKSNVFPTGTIIFANNLPVVQPPTLLNPPIILNATPNNTLIVVNQNKNTTATQKLLSKSSEQSKINSLTKTLSPIRPKRSITKTTHVNKVPIPASRYASNYILLSNVPSIVPPKNEVLKKVVKKGKSIKDLKKRPAEQKVELETIKKAKLNESNKEDLAEQTIENKKTDYTIDSICKENVNSEEKIEESVKILEATGNISEGDKITLVTDKREKEINTELNSQENIIILDDKNSSIGEKTSENTPDESQISSPVRTNEQNSFDYNKEVFETEKSANLVENICLDNKILETEKQPYECNKILLEVAAVSELKESTTTTTTVTCPPVTISCESIVTPLDPPTTNYEPIKVSEVENKVETKSISIEKLSETPTKPLEILHSELSNDIFASLQVPSGSQNPESTSPTAAFLNAFPLVSSFTGVKVTEVMEEETSDSPHGTPTLLQIGTMDTAKPTQTTSESLTPNLLNLDNFSFFSSKEICSNLYNTLDNLGSTIPSNINEKTQKKLNVISTAKILYDNAINDTECLKEDVKIAPVKNKLDKVVTTVTIQNPYSVSNTYSQAFYANTQVVDTSVAQVSTGVNYAENKPKEKSSCSRYSSYNMPEYNTFNPFTDIPKTTNTTYNQTKAYNQAVYTNNTNCNYNYQEFNTNYSMKNVKSDIKYYGMNYESYDNGNHYNTVTTNYYNSNIQSKNKYPPKTKPIENIPRPPVNWMTAPDLKQQTNDFVVPQFPKESEFPSNIYSQNNFVSNSQTTYFNSTASIYPSDYHNTFTEPKKLDQFSGNNFQRSEEDHQFTWSPSKLPQLLDQSQGFVTTTLPTLVGDLALGNTYLDKSKVKTKVRQQQNYDSVSNFLSVSQLVDHAKVDNVPSRVSARRNSGSRNKSTKSSKRVTKVENKDNMHFKVEKVQMKYDTSDWIPDTTKRVKNPPSSYSAEALIGQTAPIDNKQRTQQQNYGKTLPVPSFLPDNLITYFPVDIQQDNNFTSQQNQNYQNNTFTHSFPSSIQNNSYTGTFIPNPTTTYLPSTNFIPEIVPPPDFNSSIADNIFSHSKPIENKQFKTHQKTPNKTMNNTTPKKSKKRSNNEPGNFVDFSIFSMSGTINSPILPDDFHTPNFLPPPPNPNQLYSCKNSLYPKQGGDIGGSLLSLPVSRNNIQHQPEISPSLNTVGTSLTNFNLSTIFPEMNKVSVPDMYLDSAKSKDYGLQRSYLSTSSQIPFSKGPIYSSITTQSFSNS